MKLPGTLATAKTEVAQRVHAFRESSPGLGRRDEPSLDQVTPELVPICAEARQPTTGARLPQSLLRHLEPSSAVRVRRRESPCSHRRSPLTARPVPARLVQETPHYPRFCDDRKSSGQARGQAGHVRTGERFDCGVERSGPRCSGPRCAACPRWRPGGDDATVRNWVRPRAQSAEVDASRWHESR